MQLALIMGARVEAKISDKWINIFHVIFGSKTEIRVHPDDESILSAVAKFAELNTYKFERGNAVFSVPKIAVGGPLIVLPSYETIRIDVNGVIEEVTTTTTELSIIIQDSKCYFGRLISEYQ